MNVLAAAPTDADTTGTMVPLFEDFFLEQHEQMVRALSIALGDDELAADTAAEGFTRASRSWNKVSQYNNPAGWVYRVAINWSNSRLRKWRREVSRGKAQQGRAELLQPADLELQGALAELSQDHRNVVVGRFYLDWSEAQLAEALDIAPGTVKSRLSRALANLDKLLKDQS